MDTMSYQTAIAPAFTAAQRQACQAHQVGRFVEDGTLYLERACDGECGRYYALPIENTEMLDAAVKLYAVDEYLCPACREARAARLMRQVATLIGKPYAETRGGGSGSGSKAHQDTPRRPRQKMTPTEKRIRQLLRAWRKCQDDETRELIETQLARLGYKFAAVGAA